MSNPGFMYTMIKKVAEFDPASGDVEKFLDVLAQHLAEGRREHSFLKECRLCDIGVIRKSDHTELRYYMWCSSCGPEES